MATITAEPRKPVSKQVKKHVVLAMCGTVLTLAVATGIGAWQISERGGSEPAAVISQPVQMAGATDSGVAARRADMVPPSQDPQPTVYLTDSQAAANLLLQAITDTDADRASLGLPALDVHVIVITSPEREAAVIAGLNDSDGVRAHVGLPPTHIVDLRTPAGAHGE